MAIYLRTVCSQVYSLASLVWELHWYAAPETKKKLIYAQSTVLRKLITDPAGNVVHVTCMLHANNMILACTM